MCLTAGSTVSFAQHAQVDMFRYNSEQHSPRRQAKVVATTYKNLLALSSEQTRKLYRDLLEVYRGHSTMMMNERSDRSARLAVAENTAHARVKMTMSEILSKDQLEGFKELKHYPELTMGRGGY